MRRWLIAQGIVVVALVGCGDAAPPADAGVDAPTADVGVDTPAAVDVVEKPADTGREIPSCPTPVSGGDGGVTVRGHGMTFGPTGGRIRDAVVTVREHPGWCARTGSDGAYELGGFAPGERVTLEMHHADYWPIQTGTYPVAADGARFVGFQAPTNGIFRVLAQYLRITPDPTRCQIATTVVARGYEGYDPGGRGEVGATVTIDPPLPPDAGPVYFRYLSPSAIVPARELTETSLDGGVLFLNVPPGDYVLRAHKAGVTFNEVAIRCRAGVLVNASPPWGLQVQ
ncbi:MAG: hypothetical protein Q8S73_30850 [Deltaproteobacteria bacterium]|nr:hypothetical protein [Myxococcales bacterium]MDP3218542.1 hypothetical protein [Deltaproteobacteria bacterium]